jgi:hypothetical protein
MTPRRDELATVHPGRALATGTVVEVEVAPAPISRHVVPGETMQIHATNRATAIFHVEQ